MISTSLYFSYNSLFFFVNTCKYRALQNQGSYRKDMENSILCFMKNFCLFGLVLYVPVNSYGHGRTVSSPNHTFFLGKLD